MTAVILREVFSDTKASEQATIEAEQVLVESVQIAEKYMILANQLVELSKVQKQGIPSQPPQKSAATAG